MSDNFDLEERSPSREEYISLRESVGWNGLDNENVEYALNRSLYSVCVKSNSELVGFGRVIGDGGVYYYIQDVIVSPSHQGKGIGAIIMNALTSYLDANAPANSFIGLMSASGMSEFYIKYGFVRRASDAPGMYKYVK